MLDPVIEKRIGILQAICDELPLVVSENGWSDYALGLLAKMQRIAAVLDDPDAEAEKKIAELIGNRAGTR